MQITKNNRDDIGRKYDITASSTIFTGPASQKQAERAGYEIMLSQEYDQVVDDNGDALFADIDAKACKLMTKELRWEDRRGWKDFTYQL